MDFLFANWDVLACVSTWKSVDTWEGADTSRCRHVPTSIILIIWTFYLHTGMCWHVSAPAKVPTPGKVPTRADTSRCRHVPTSLILIIWTFLFGCWYVLTCVSTWKGADTCECTHTCRHVKVPNRADIPDTNHMDFLFGNWDILTCVSTWKGADTWECADTSRCRHVPTSVILIIWTFLFVNWDVLACVSTWKGADTWEGADTSRCRHVPTRADIPDTNHMDFLFANWDVLACVITWKGADRNVPTRLGADTCRHPSY